MRAKHTKGPWKVFYASNGSMLGVGVDRPRSVKHGTGVADAQGGLWGMGGEKQANAHLIAAAPDLLAALRRLEAACDDLAGTRSTKTYLYMIDVDQAKDALLALDFARDHARATIAKAEDGAA